MFLVFLLGLIILIVEFIGRFIHPLYFFGRLIPPAVLIMPIISPLRDLIQQRRQRVYALIAMFIAVICFLFTTTLHGAEIAAATLMWVEIVDFLLYSYFRRYGWLVGVIVSDLVAVPMLLPMYVWLRGYPISAVPAYIYVAEFCSLLLVYVIMLATPIRNLFVGLPMLGKRQEG